MVFECRTGERHEAESALEAERRSVAGYRQRADEDERNKRVLVGHLEDASKNIGRLKELCGEQTAKAQTATKERTEAVATRDAAMAEAKEKGAAAAKAEAEMAARADRLSRLEREREARGAEFDTSASRLAEYESLSRTLAADKERAMSSLEGESRTRH